MNPSVNVAVDEFMNNRDGTVLCGVEEMNVSAWMNSFQKMNAEISPGCQRQHNLRQDLPSARAVIRAHSSSSNGIVLM
jgi:hypothetical protein